MIALSHFVLSLFSKTFDFISGISYFELGVITALESTFFPVFVPIETFIIPMGYLASLGQRSIPMLLISCTIGIIIGCLINYMLAMFLGRPLIYKFSKYFIS